MDPRPIELHPEAIAEARAAREWYEARSAAAADAFMTELDDAIHRVNHRRFGEIEVFIQRVQMESHPQGNTFEIVFS